MEPMVWVELSWRMCGYMRSIGPRIGSRGQSTVEYALVGALVVIGAAGALTLLGSELSTVFTNITNALKAAPTH